MTEISIHAERIETHKVPIVVLDIGGEIDASSYEALEAAAREAYAAGDRYLLLDLTDVPYISSSGLRAMHRIFTLLRSEATAESDAAMRKGLRDGSFTSAHLKLLNPQPAVKDVLKTAGFDMYLEMYNDRAAALAAFG